MRAQSAAAVAALSVASGAAAYGTPVPYGGVNLAGCDFGCDVEGSCTESNVARDLCPKDAEDQMKHFASTYGHNMFRLPVGWQYLTGGKMSGEIGGDVWTRYKEMMKGCLATGKDTKCIVDIHNYGKYDKKDLGPGESDKAFADLWSNIAKEYKNEPNVMFGIMNEPHDQDGSAWKTTCQGAVDAIRDAGATDQMILIPGPDWSHVGEFKDKTSKYSLAIKDKADKSGKNLLMDLHQYFDSDNSGTHTECEGYDKVAQDFKDAVGVLKGAGRKAVLSEFGGGNTPSCLKTVGEALDYLNENGDAFYGWTGWAAGAFDDSYELVETPVDGKDKPMVKENIGGKFKGKGGGNTPPVQPPANIPANKPARKPATQSGGSYTPPTPPAKPYNPPTKPDTPNTPPTPGTAPYNPPAKQPKKKCKKRPSKPQSSMPAKSGITTSYTPTPTPKSYTPPTPPAQAKPQPYKPAERNQPKQYKPAGKSKPEESKKYDSGSSQPSTYQKLKRAVSGFTYGMI